MLRARLAALVLLTLSPTSLAWGQGEPVNNEKIAVGDVPAEAKTGADGVAPKTKWESAFRMSKDSGPTRLWYRLLGIQTVKPAKVDVKADGDVDETPAVVRAVQVRVLPDGKVIDVWLQASADDLPNTVTQALNRVQPNAQPSWVTAVKLGTSSDIVGYRVEFPAADGGRIVYEVTADGKSIQREGGS